MKVLPLDGTMLLAATSLILLNTNYLKSIQESMTRKAHTSFLGPNK